MKIQREYKPEQPPEEPGEIDEHGLELALIEAKERRLHKAFALKDQIGLSDDERHELAQMIPGVDKDQGGSWKELNLKQLHDLVTMLEGWVFIQTLHQQRIQKASGNFPNHIISSASGGYIVTPNIYTSGGGWSGTYTAHTHGVA